MRDLPNTKSDIKIIVSYKSTEDLAIYLGFAGKKEKIKAKWQPDDIPNGSYTTFGNGRRGNCGYEIGMYLTTSFFYKLTETGANNLMSGKTTPHALERLSIEDAIELFAK